MRNRGFDALSRAAFPVRARVDLENLGSNGYIVPTSVLSSDSICWCAGVGEDISFDLELIKRFHCHVWAVDPTARAARYVQEVANDEPGFHFLPVGLWCEERVMRFYESSLPEDVSHSALNIQRTEDYFEASCRPLDALMSDAGQSRIDLLKLDIEGAEYRVLGHLLRIRLLPRILVVEFHHFEPPTGTRFLPRTVLVDFYHLLGWLRTARSVRALLKAGYELAAVDRWHFSFVRSGL